MFKRIANAALKVDAQVAGMNLISKNAYIRYAIPFMQKPKFDNTNVVKEYINLVDAKNVPNYFVARVKCGIWELSDINTQSLKLVIFNNELIEDPEHVNTRNKYVYGGFAVIHAGLSAMLGYDIFMSHPIATIFVYVVSASRIGFEVNQHSDISGSLKNAMRKTEVAFKCDPPTPL